MTSAPGQPDAAVLAAFGAAGTPLRLGGGRGSSWRVGDLVLKPADLGEDELRWQHETLARSAQRRVPGRTATTRR